MFLVVFYLFGHHLIKHRVKARRNTAIINGRVAEEFRMNAYSRSTLESVARGHTSVNIAIGIVSHQEMYDLHRHRLAHAIGARNSLINDRGIPV